MTIFFKPDHLDWKKINLLSYFCLILRSKEGKMAIQLKQKVKWYDCCEWTYGSQCNWYNIIQIWFLNTYSITHRISLIFSRVRSETASCSFRIFFVHISNFLSSLKGFLIVGSLRLKRNKVKEQTYKVKIHRYKQSEQTNKQTMYFLKTFLALKWLLIEQPDNHRDHPF